MQRTLLASVYTAIFLFCGSLLSPAATPDTSLTSSGTSVTASEKPSIVRNLEPLSVRGTNYFPRLTPWSEMWTSTSLHTIEQDMARTASLNMNTIRTFIFWNEAIEAAGLIAPDGTPSEEYLRKVDQLLGAAWRHGIRVVLCFEFEYGNRTPKRPPEAAWKRALSTFIERHRDDGRVLMWDLMNEPERHGWDEATKEFLVEALALTRQLDPNHLTTVGIGWQIWNMPYEALPDVLQYHEYSPRKELDKTGWRRIRRSITRMRLYGGNRPIVIGEFGISSASDPKFGAGKEWINRTDHKTETEAQQKERYELIFRAAEDQSIAGVLNWCLYDYPTTETGWLQPSESMFGLIRMDDTLKPAALETKRRFEQWQKQARLQRQP